jgi:CRP-like cAMP-binding protein
MGTMRDELVRRFPSLAESLSTEELDHLMAVLERRQVADGEVLLTDGMPSSAAYLLVDGALRIVLNAGGTGVDAGVLEPGCWVGEVSLLDGGPATATAIATAPTVVLALARGALEELRKREPRVAASLVRAMSMALAARLRRATDQLEALRGMPASAEDEALDALRALMGARG